ncbi:MAG: hypothetical protein A2138_04250 [Deltaproteobacteria bacterium RBG_16_71_12]|nr:MAG: hypothetical protein A2138_04250 [Deltaproteobacteria bacterium RBG_16_71_12]
MAAVQSTFIEKLTAVRAILDHLGLASEPMPLTHVGVDEEDGVVRVTLFPDGGTLPPFGARCQVRARPDAPPDELIFLHADDGACALARAALPTAAADVQVGYLVDDELLFDAWTEVRLE